METRRGNWHSPTRPLAGKVSGIVEGEGMRHPGYQKAKLESLDRLSTAGADDAARDYYRRP